ELQPCGLRHAARVPRRIPDDLDLHLADTGDALDLAPDVFFEHVAHAAAGRGHGHVDLDTLPAFRQRYRLAAVDETEVDEIYGDLRVEHRPELLPDAFFLEGAFDHRRRRGSRRSVLAERVGIL